MALFTCQHCLRTSSRSGLRRGLVSRLESRWDLNIATATAEGNVLDLGSVTTTGDTDTDVEAGELIEANNEQGLVDLNRWDVSRPFCNRVPS